MKDNNEQLFCSFCGKPKELTEQLIAGPNGIFICNECIEVCHDVLKEKKTESEDTTAKVNLLNVSSSISQIMKSFVMANKFIYEHVYLQYHI